MAIIHFCKFRVTPFANEILFSISKKPNIKDTSFIDQKSDCIPLILDLCTHSKTYNPRLKTICKKHII